MIEEWKFITKKKEKNKPHLETLFSTPHFCPSAAKQRPPWFSPFSSAMAPTAAAELLEVRYAGCGEMLEVDWGLVKFICLDCATPQSLPSELLPKLPNRKALPLPWGTTDVRGVRLPYGACGALLSVRLHRCTYPVRGAELTVDTARLKQYLLLSAVASDTIPMLPLGATSSGSPMHVLGRCGTNRRHVARGARLWFDACVEPLWY
jgi:hypothetical protein